MFRRRFDVQKVILLNAGAAFFYVTVAVLTLGATLCAPAQAETAEPIVSTASGLENTLGNQSDSDIWRALRYGLPGRSSTQQVEDAILINAEGVWWSDIRQFDGPLVRYGLYGLAAVASAVLLFFLLRGRMRLEGGRSGRNIERFSLTHRITHWSIAALFLLLAMTGLILIFGRLLLIPLIGRDAFSVLATASMQAHNLFGPVFFVSLCALFITFVRGNVPTLRDFGWLIRVGGTFGGHVSAGRYNAGEKAWFWIVMLAGLALSASGLVLSFPDDLGTRNLLHLSELTHAIAALIFIGFSIGHIYLGTIGVEGTLEGMVEGCVDENWARSHHDLWLEEIQATEEAKRS